MQRLDRAGIEVLLETEQFKSWFAELSGLQHRLERYEIEEGGEASWIAGDYVRPEGQPFAGELLPPGAQATPGFRPDDSGAIRRTNLSAYGELGWSLSENLFLNGMVR